MSSRYVELPNGSYMEWPQGVSAADFKAKAQRYMAGQREVAKLPKADQITLQQFGALIKAKYPSYASKSDEEVGQAMLAKYPQYGNRVKGQKSLSAPPDETPKNVYWDALTDPVGSGGRDQGVFGGALQVGGQAIKTMAQPFMHPIDTAVGIAKVGSDVARGDTYSFGQDTIGPMVQNYARDKAKGGHALAVENLTGNLLGTIEGGRMVGAGTKAVGGKLAEAGTAAREWWRPTPSPEVVPVLEQSARKLTDAINPNPAEANQFIENLQQRMPEITDYAKRTKNPLKTRLEFAKAAEGAGTEVYNWYKKNLLGPVEKEEASITPDYRGKRINVEGGRATVGDIDKRLTAINKELRPDYRQRNAGMVGSKLASEAELNAEAANLRSIINRHLAKTSGLSEAEVSAVRQTAGQLRSIADATNETVTQRGLSAARATEGSLPMSKSGALVEGWRTVRGGKNAIADRMFQRALAEFNEQRPSSFHPIADKFAKSARPIPEAAARNPRPARQPATGPSEPPSAGTISQAEQQEFLSKVQERLAGRKKAIAEKAQKRIEEAAAEEARKAANRATAGKRLQQ